MGFKTTVLIVGLGLMLSAWGLDLSAPGALPVELAFQPKVLLNPAGAVVTIRIAPDHYLYRDRIQAFSLEKEALALHLPKGIPLLDPVIGGQHEVYRESVSFTVALPPNTGTFELRYQGCAEKLGVCYPLQKRVLSIKP